MDAGAGKVQWWYGMRWGNRIAAGPQPSNVKHVNKLTFTKAAV